MKERKIPKKRILKKILKCLILSVIILQLVLCSVFATDPSDINYLKLSDEFIESLPEYLKADFMVVSQCGLFVDSDILSVNSHSEYITRGNFSKLLNNLIQLYGGVEGPAIIEFFEDADEIYDETNENGKYDFLLSKSFGILDGTSIDGKLYADLYSPLTREQAAKMICNTLRFIENNLDIPYTDTYNGYREFKDSSIISRWAYEYVRKVLNLNIMIGDNDSNFNPKDNITWGQAAIIMNRLYGNLSNSLLVEIFNNSTDCDLSLIENTL